MVSGERQTIATYLWLTGATTVKHFSCYYVFLGGVLYQARWQMWARIIRPAHAHFHVARAQAVDQGGMHRREGWPFFFNP